ncbi:FAD-binding oxidoreductase [Paenibacillus sp. SYP-B3998]|uniref:FAD-binding oxidoreductase n=1 Tax=Paenibacillus sp. SYP-B3998 TaxID=2678564 RepID=A0A6G3ZXL1_9BACL|nr:FAD-binding oxidoreductase [Paenibacillus sp. SYP-B3998]NEW06147.1 FAD-binding oxidoreductase [Paenibacillus sp. SYP-B3998]
MDLHTGSLLWPNTFPEFPVYPVLESDIECEVLIIGGGSAGALMAYELTQHGVDTVLIDKRNISGGTSCANTGLLQFASDKHLTACMHTYGVDKGIRLYQLCKDAINELEQITSMLEIDSKFVRRSSLYFSSCQEHLPLLKAEFAALIELGIDAIYLEEEQISKLYSFRKSGAILSNNDAEVNPFRMVHALIHHANQKGMRVYEQTEVLRQSYKQNTIIFHLKNQRTIRARKAIFATGYETQSFKKNPNAVMSSSYVLATQPLSEFPGWPDRCLIWETARPYLYIRTTLDNRIIIGGLDEATKIPAERDARLLHKKDLLLLEIQKLFPGLPALKAEHYWAATFGGTHDGFPMFGPQAGYPHCYFILGYGGNGTVYNKIAAKIIAGLILNGSHPDAELFRFDRSPSSGV